MNDKFDINKEESRKLLSRVVLGLVAIFGIVFMIIGALSIYQQQVYKNDYLHVTGTVTSNMTDSKGRYIPTYIYEVGGTSYTSQSDYSFVNLPAVGTEHTIYYLEGKEAYGIAEYFDANQLLLVIGAMMLTLPLAIYLLDIDSLRYDKYAKLKAVFVTLLAVLYYLGSAWILGTYSVATIFNYSGVLIVVPIVYIIAGVYAMIASNYIPEKKHLGLFKIHKKSEK